LHGACIINVFKYSPPLASPLCADHTSSSEEAAGSGGVPMRCRRVRNSHFNPTDFPNLKTLPPPAPSPSAPLLTPLFALGRWLAFRAPSPQACRFVGMKQAAFIALPPSKTTTPREELWTCGLSLSSPSSRQSGYLGICCLIRCAGAKLSCGAEAARRVARVWERGGGIGRCRFCWGAACG